MIDHLEIESTVLHKDSEEAQIQMQRDGANKLGACVDIENIFLKFLNEKKRKSRNNFLCNIF